MQISFVIPVYNQREHTRDCLASLAAHVPDGITHEIIVIDDGSDPITRNYLDSLPPPIRVIHLERNAGFARATNQGAAAATGTWLCLLNNDVELTSGAIATMGEVTTSHPDAGIVGNIQITTATGEVDHAGIDFVDGGYPRHRRGALADLQAQGDVVPVPAVTAACCLVRRTWFEAVGGLDERYRNGFEDVDLCLRSRENGLAIYVANRSVVRHAVSLSEGRSRFEFRNAQKLLERWGPRTAAIEQAEREAAARRFRIARANSTPAPGDPPAVTAARQAVLAAEKLRAARADQPVVVWIDLLRLEPGGANGGIKPLVQAFLRELIRLPGPPQTYVVFVRDGLAPEFDYLRPRDALVLQGSAGWRLQTNGEEAVPCPLTEIETRFPPEVLYGPFTTSSFARPNLPMISLIVDVLHRDLPSALPIEEVNFREDGFKRALRAATWVQTLAHHGIERLGHHYGVHPARCFHTYAPVQGRLTSTPPEATRPKELPARPFFFYPANFWPHKNHEVLLAAYHHYRHSHSTDAWDLLLTGHPDARMQTLREMSTALGLQGRVHFAGHLPDPAFAAVWHHASALVFPSLHEGFGIPLVEAFQAGVPVIAARASALPEVGGEACAWFDPRDPLALSTAMTDLTRDPSRRTRLIAAGRARLGRFSLTVEAARLHHFLHAAARNLVP